MRTHWNRTDARAHTDDDLTGCSHSQSRSCSMLDCRRSCWSSQSGLHCCRAIGWACWTIFGSDWGKSGRFFSWTHDFYLSSHWVHSNRPETTRGLEEKRNLRKRILESKSLAIETSTNYNLLVGLPDCFKQSKILRYEEWSSIINKHTGHIALVHT